MLTSLLSSTCVEKTPHWRIWSWQNNNRQDYLQVTTLGLMIHYSYVFRLCVFMFYFQSQPKHCWSKPMFGIKFIGGSELVHFKLAVWLYAGGLLSQVCSQNWINHATRLAVSKSSVNSHASRTCCSANQTHFWKHYLETHSLQLLEYQPMFYPCLLINGRGLGARIGFMYTLPMQIQKKSNESKLQYRKLSKRGICGN